MEGSTGMSGSLTAELRTIIELQRVDLKLAELQKSSSAIPRELETGRAGLEAARAAVERVEADLEALQKEDRARERRIEEVREGQQKSKARLMEVKTNEEYTALLKEIEYADQQIGQLEEEVLGSMERVEAQQVELKSLQERLKVEEEGYGKEKGLKEAELQRVGALLGEEEALRSELTGRISRGLLASYNRIRANKGGLAVASVAGGVCQGCNQRIPRQTHIDIRKNEVLFFCQGCSRILFHADDGLEA